MELLRNLNWSVLSPWVATSPKKETSSESADVEINDEPEFNPGVANVLRTYSKLKRKSPETSPECENKKIEQSTPEKSLEEKLPPAKRSSTFSGSCSPSAKNMKIYVRLKPLQKAVHFSGEQQERYRIIGPELFINLSDVQQDMSKMIDVVAKKFVFSEALGEEINQTEMFERVVAPQVEKFIGGTSCTVMAYGAKASGKSYTVNGTPTDPGLIQKTLDYIVSLKTVKPIPSYKPVDNSLKCLTSTERDVELNSRERPCSSSLISCTEGVDALEACENTTHAQYEVWVSFVEIRDENYFDLLSSDYLEAHSLKMEFDSEGKGFIKGLKHVFVGTALEAKEVLHSGRDNFSRWHEINKTETTKSHSIFTVALLKYCTLDDAGSVQMSKFSFGVLAAQESPELDPSLLALLNCLECTKNLHLPTPHPEPIECFHPSRLTDLFKDALTGESPFSLIVTVDPNPEVYLETHGVLHSTSHSTEILTKIRNPHPPKPSTGFGKLAERPQEIVDWEDLTPERLTLLSDAFQDEISVLELLNLRGDVEIRQKIIKRYSNIIERIENFYKRKSEADLHSEDIDALRTVSQKLRSHKQLLERELAVVMMELNEMSGESLEPHDEIGNQNPYVLLFEETIAEKETRAKNDHLITQLNETRGEYLRVLRKTRERERKIVEIERKYMALKMNRECEFIQHRNVNYCFKEQMGVLMRLEERLQKEKIWCQRFQEDCEGFKSMRKTQTEERNCEEGQDASRDIESEVFAGEDREGAPESCAGSSEEQIVPLSPQVSGPAIFTDPQAVIIPSGNSVVDSETCAVGGTEIVPVDSIPPTTTPTIPETSRLLQENAGDEEKSFLAADKQGTGVNSLENICHSLVSNNNHLFFVPTSAVCSIQDTLGNVNVNSLDETTVVSERMNIPGSATQCVAPGVEEYSIMSSDPESVGNITISSQMHKDRLPEIFEEDSDLSGEGANIADLEYQFFTPADRVLPSEVPIDKIPEAEGSLESFDPQNEIPEPIKQNTELITIAEECKQLENQPLVGLESEKTSTSASEVHFSLSTSALEINSASEEIALAESASIPHLDGQLFVPEDRALLSNKNPEFSNLESREIYEPEECSEKNDTCNHSRESLESLEIQDNTTSKLVENEQENSQMIEPSLPELESIIHQPPNISPKTGDLSPEAALYLPESLMNISKHELITFAISQSLAPPHQLLETPSTEEFPIDSITSLEQQDKTTPVIVDDEKPLEDVVNINNNKSSVSTSMIEEKSFDLLEHKATVLQSVDTSEVGVLPLSESVMPIEDKKINIPLAENSSTMNSTLFPESEASTQIKKEPIAIIEDLKEQKNYKSNLNDGPQPVVSMEEAAKSQLKATELKNIDSSDRKKSEGSPTEKNGFTLLQETVEAPAVLQNSLEVIENVKDVENNRNTLSEISQLLIDVHIETPSPSTSETPSCTSEDSLVNGGSTEMGLITTRSRTRKRSGSPLRTPLKKHAKLFPPDKPTRRSPRMRPEGKFLTVICDNCNQVIQEEYRYHCKVCLNGGFDLCEKCFKKDRHQHKVDHVLTIPKGFIRG
uniref:Sub_5 protein n=1 Tax=Fopius arisanus TaxID=64838 RepID=A0A0C9QPH3_9HYME